MPSPRRHSKKRKNPTVQIRSAFKNTNLMPRAKIIAELAAQGNSAEQIAKILATTKNVIANQLCIIYAELGLSECRQLETYEGPLVRVRYVKNLRDDEKLILRALIRGNTAEEIADDLKISKDLIELRIWSICNLLNIRSEKDLQDPKLLAALGIKHSESPAPARSPDLSAAQEPR